MHEMGVVIQIIKTANGFAEQNGVKKVRKLILQIGEASSVMPRYVNMFYYDVISDYPLLSESELKIEMVPAKAFCLECGKEFLLNDCCEEDDCSDNKDEQHYSHNTKECPHCGSISFKVTEGNTLYIKEMEVE